MVILRRRVRRQTRIIQLKLQNELALEERYRRVFERNLTGLYIANPDGTIVDCNDACARILGFSSREERLEHHEEAEKITRRLYAGTEESPIVNAEHRF